MAASVGFPHCRFWPAIVFAAVAPWGAAFAQAPSPSRLSGIVIGPTDRVAIFADPAHGVPVAVREGDLLGEWRVQAINPGSVLVAGPEGPYLIEVQPADHATAPQPVTEMPAQSVLASARETGMSVGRLATHHDACVRQGFAAPSGRSGEDQFRAMLDAMSNVPARTGADAALDAPAKNMARAMRSGWEAAMRADAGIRLDAAACRQVGELWKQTASRYGFQ